MQVYNVNFGAKINNVPNLKNLAGKQLALEDTKLCGYTAFIGGKVYTPAGKIVKQDILFDGKKIVAVNDFDEKLINEKINYVVLKNKTITPGIFDEHIHGGYGVNFSNSGEQEIRDMLKTLGKSGTVGILATILPGDDEQIYKQAQILSNIIENPDDGAAIIYGIHFEGFLNPKKKGIHSKEDLRMPTIKNYKRLFGHITKYMKIVTLAPERDRHFSLTKFLKKSGVIVSAGHSCATAKQMSDSGITQVTHVFNAMSMFHHRNLTILNAALSNDDITTELLADEATVNPSVMDILMKLKKKDKIVLVSDALPYAGRHEDFVMGRKKIHVDKDGIPRDDNGILAGNMKFLHEVAPKLIKDTIMTFSDFIKYASVNPARNNGVLDDFKIQQNSAPHFSVWDNKTKTIEKTFIA